MTFPNEILMEEVASLLEEGKDVELTPKGTSMLPFIIGDRDSVILRKEHGGSLVPGDVVLARRSTGNYVLHRIIYVDGEKLTLRGDGNVYGTEIVGKSDILGRVVAFVKPSGRRFVPGRALIWRKMPALFRRCILAVYRRTIYRILRSDIKFRK